MKLHIPLLAVAVFASAASFGPVVFRSWVLQHDIDGGGHTISNAVFEGDGSGLTGIGGGTQTPWSSDINAGRFNLTNFNLLSSSDNTGAGSEFSIFNYDTNNNLLSKIEMYAYADVSTIRLVSGAKDCVVIDPSQDLAEGQPFFFSSSTTVAGNSPIFSIQNNGTNKVIFNGSGALALAGTTNQIIFGATNTAPVSSVAAAKWISVQVSGFTNAYRIPLYE